MTVVLEDDPATADCTLPGQPAPGQHHPPMAPGSFRVLWCNRRWIDEPDATAARVVAAAGGHRVAFTMANEKACFPERLSHFVCVARR